MIRIHVVELPERRGRFVARLENGREVVRSSRQPFLDAARALLAEGADPADILIMMRGQTQSLSGPIGKVAKLTVAENDRLGPRFARWEPMTAEKMARAGWASDRPCDKIVVG